MRRLSRELAGKENKFWRRSIEEGNKSSRHRNLSISTSHDISNVMGIPHLITYLRPFAIPVDLAGHSVVIDGPGLAYHVWHICLSSKARNPFEATPSYRVLGEMVIRWLDELQVHDVYLYEFLFCF